MKLQTTIFITVLVVQSVAVGGEISGDDLRTHLASKSSGTFLVSDIVQKIGITMSQGEFDVTLSGQILRIRPSRGSNQQVSFSGNSLTLSEKRTSAQHPIGSRYDKRVILQTGSTATFLLNLSSGRIVSAKIATDEDRLSLKFIENSAKPEGVPKIDSEVQARTLLIEIQKLEQEIKSGISGKANVRGSDSFGQGFQGNVTYKFSEAEIAEKKKLLELKRAQFNAILHH